MGDGPAQATRLGYCTNVHAGESLAETTANLRRHATAVRALYCPQGPLGVGLWLSARAARALQGPEGPPALAATLNEHGLEVFTINGFPYGDFHQQVVKHDVYRPDWRQRERLEYTLDLARILAALVPEDGQGSISTLPVGWGPWLRRGHDLQAAAANLHLAVDGLADLHERTGRLIHLDLEPEPGCVLQKSRDVVDFFQRYVLEGRDTRQYLRVCHDICHAAVMFEDQEEVIDRYESAGILIGKVQISNAVKVRFDALDDAQRREAMTQLKQFDERRYLHQTVVRPDDAAEPVFFEDLPEALASAGDWPSGEWRVHFHVPVYLERLGRLETSRLEIEQCLHRLQRTNEVRHFEAETYAWDVLPHDQRHGSLAEGIARELAWCADRLAVEARG